MGWQLHTDVSVNNLLLQFEQTERLVRLMWHPLCIAALNTPPERASANTFLAVLRDSLGASRAASDMLIPRAPLGAILPELAIRYLQQQQMSVQTGIPVRTLHRHGDHWTLSNAETSLSGEFDQVVIATDIRTASACWPASAMQTQRQPCRIISLKRSPRSICNIRHLCGWTARSTLCRIRLPASITDSSYLTAAGWTLSRPDYWQW
jgi:predicted NAD/FAD-binding protein